MPKVLHVAVLDFPFALHPVSLWSNILGVIVNFIYFHLFATFILDTFARNYVQDTHCPLVLNLIMVLFNPVLFMLSSKFSPDCF